MTVSGFCLGHEDFVVRESEFLSTEGDVADAVGLLDFAGGEAALVVDAAHVQRLAVFRISAGECSRGHVGAVCAHPVVGAAHQHLRVRRNIISLKFTNSE